MSLNKKHEKLLQNKYLLEFNELESTCDKMIYLI
jgi:hypothetical protein